MAPLYIPNKHKMQLAANGSNVILGTSSNPSEKPDMWIYTAAVNRSTKMFNNIVTSHLSFIQKRETI